MAHTDGPFPYYGDMFAGGTTAHSIRTTLEDPKTSANAINALAGELEGDAQRVATHIEGDITADVQTNPQVASVTAKTLAAKGTYAVAVINSFADMVDTFDTKVNSLNERFHTGMAGKKADAADDTPKPGDGPQPTVADMRHAVKASLQPEYDAALLKLDGEAESIKDNLDQGATEENVRELIRAGLIPLSAAALYPGLKLETADYVGALQHMSAQEQIDWINQNKDNLPAEAAAAIKPEVQEQYANQIAEDIKDPDDIDEETVKLLKFFQGQDAFAHQLYTEVSPDEFADAVQNLSYQAFPPHSGSMGPGPDAMKNAELYKGFLDAAGATFATFTKGTGAYAPPSDLSETWFKAITDEENPENAAALTLLIRHGGQQTSLDDEFMSNLTGKVYEWERSHDGDPVWGPLDEKLGGYEYGIKDPTFEYGDDPDESYDDRAFGNSAYDGLANLLGGMEHTPEGAQDFFMGNYPGSTESLEERMDYLMGGEDARTFAQDDGDGLGNALQAAAVGGSVRDADGTAITNELFKTIAEHSGEGQDNSLDNSWHVWNGMTDSLGTIASGYTGDVYESLSGGVIESGSTHLSVSPDELETVLGEIGHSDDKSGLETLTAAMHMEVRNQNIEYLQGVDGRHDLASLPNTSFNGMQMGHGEVMASLLDHGLAIAEDEDKTDAARAALLSKGLDIAGGFIPGAGSVLGEGASELAKNTYDTISGEALSALSDGVKDSDSSTTDEFRSAAVESVPQQLRYAAISDLYRAGYLDEQDLPDGTHFQGAPDLVFTGQPPTLRPELIDEDGYVLDDTDIPEDQRPAIIDAWDDFHHSPAWDALTEESYSTTFYDAVQK